MLNIVE